ncbi:hypothetical protein ACJIZ3_004233 [Penstemon smallii]|uniref:F-box associated beta-propeller type 3 domain-containing protein n=1 Tax=Penstemon smallii TaxID=265156 RepID=A0ABD3S1I1_9LAMI
MIEINKEGEFIQTRLEPKVPGLSGRDTKLSVIGSSNGLLCFSLIKTGDENETRYVANPVMGEYIELPQLKREPKDEYVLQIFGYSPSTNNFKVMIVDYNRTGEGNLRWKVSILTVGVDDKWRHLPNPCPWSICFDGVLVNGAFHWIIYGQRMIEILTFNLCEEKFDRISRLPVVMHDLENMNLAAINNKLCVIDYKVPSIIVTIWTMQEYGVLDSWTKDVVSFNCFSSGLRYPSIVPIATLPNGEILFHFKFMSYIISYNPIQKTCSVIEGFNAFQMLSYAPRLSSLKHIIFGEEAPRFSSLENVIIKEEAPRFSSLENVIVGEEALRFASVENVVVGENVAVTNHLYIRSFIFISSIIGMFINYCALLKTKYMAGRGRGN